MILAVKNSHTGTDRPVNRRIFGTDQRLPLALFSALR
jgi:hypothetical protein